MDKNILPADFNGVFYFTNFTDKEFKARWNKIEYTFPAQKSVPLIIPGETPEGVQSIRKKFAKELAEIEFYNSSKMKSLDALNPRQVVGSLNSAITYNMDDLAPFIQRCLEPLPVGNVTAKVLPKDDENRYRKDDDGNSITRVLNKSESLVSNQGQVIA